MLWNLLRNSIIGTEFFSNSLLFLVDNSLDRFILHIYFLSLWFNKDSLSFCCSIVYFQILLFHTFHIVIKVISITPFRMNSWCYCFCWNANPRYDRCNRRVVIGGCSKLWAIRWTFFLFFPTIYWILKHIICVNLIRSSRRMRLSLILVKRFDIFFLIFIDISSLVIFGFISRLPVDEKFIIIGISSLSHNRYLRSFFRWRVIIISKIKIVGFRLFWSWNRQSISCFLQGWV